MTCCAQSISLSLPPVCCLPCCSCWLQPPCTMRPTGWAGGWCLWQQQCAVQEVQLSWWQLPRWLTQGPCTAHMACWCWGPSYRWVAGDQCCLTLRCSSALSHGKLRPLVQDAWKAACSCTMGLIPCTALGVSGACEESWLHHEPMAYGVEEQCGSVCHGLMWHQPGVGTLSACAVMCNNAERYRTVRLSQACVGLPSYHVLSPLLLQGPSFAVASNFRFVSAEFFTGGWGWGCVRLA
jgi:hypothetical protein